MSREPIACVWFDEVPEGPWHAGWCFPQGYSLSHHFTDHVEGTRPPISVCIPMRRDTAWSAEHGFQRGTVFCVDSHPTNDPAGGWTVTLAQPLVTGERPRLTVAPSINAVDIFHGYLVDGFLSDDLEA